MNPLNAIPNAVDKLTAEWESQKLPYYRVEREYFSTGGMRFLVDGDGTAIEEPNAYNRYIVKAEAGQSAELFSYKAGDQGKASNMLINQGAQGLLTDDSHTNIKTPYQTNGEDFAVMGISFRVKGFRLEMLQDPVDANGAFPDAVIAGTSNEFRNGLNQGTIYLWDTSTDFVPPELQSPLSLEENFGRTLAKCLDLRERWNQKEGDQVSMADSLGPGGGETYLHTLGEPTTWNYRKLSKGLIWRNAGTERSQDTQFSLLATLRQDVWQKVTWPGPTVFPEGQEGDQPFPNLLAIHVDFRITLHGVAFYTPSGNR